MATMILIIAFVITAAFAAYCIVTRLDQEKTKSFIRIGVFAAFILFTLLSVIQWSFRWYPLAALLLIWAVRGAWNLISQRAQASLRAEKKEFKPGFSIFRAIATLLLVSITVTPALILPQYKQPKMTGMHSVATARYTYTDTSRTETFSKIGGNRKVNVEFWYPKDTGYPSDTGYPADAKGKYPLVVFSHGAFGVKASNTSTFMNLASNGYVVCSIDHPYHAMYTIDADRHLITTDQSFLQELLNANADKYDDATGLLLEQKWMKLRTTDINFVLDTILLHAKETGSDSIYQRIDPEEIGLMGHSLGGASSAQVARERNDIAAVINLDADLLGEYLGYKDGKVVLNNKPYPVPILTIFADDMVRLMDNNKDPNLVIAVKYVTANAPQAWEVHLTGTDHMSLTDLPLVSPFLVSMVNSAVPKGGGLETDPYATIEKMNGIVLQFFNVTLKGEGSFTVAGTE